MITILPKGTKKTASNDKIFGTSDWDNIECSMSLLPIFVSSLATANQEYQDMTNIKGINTRLCESELLKRLQKNAETHNENADSYMMNASNIYVVGYKTEETPEEVEKNMVIAHSCNKDSWQNEVNGIKAVPLSKQEIGRLINMINKCPREMNTTKDLKKLAKQLLTTGDFKKYEKETENYTTDDFYSTYKVIRQLYQSNYPYRIGIVDGAHRTSLLFNILHQQELTPEDGYKRIEKKWMDYNNLVRDKITVSLHKTTSSKYHN